MIRLPQHQLSNAYVKNHPTNSSSRSFSNPLSSFFTCRPIPTTTYSCAPRTTPALSIR